MRGGESGCHSDGRAIRLGGTEGAVGTGTLEERVKGLCRGAALGQRGLGVSAVGRDGALELVCVTTQRNHERSRGTEGEVQKGNNKPREAKVLMPRMEKRTATRRVAP